MLRPRHIILTMEEARSSSSPLGSGSSTFREFIAYVGSHGKTRVNFVGLSFDSIGSSPSVLSPWSNYPDLQVRFTLCVPDPTASQLLLPVNEGRIFWAQFTSDMDSHPESARLFEMLLRLDHNKRVTQGGRSGSVVELVDGMPETALCSIWGRNGPLRRRWYPILSPEPSQPDRSSFHSQQPSTGASRTSTGAPRVLRRGPKPLENTQCVTFVGIVYTIQTL
jgi:hypothetical protein